VSISVAATVSGVGLSFGNWRDESFFSYAVLRRSAAAADMIATVTPTCFDLLSSFRDLQQSCNGFAT
jgi:hypothetical protein